MTLDQILALGGSADYMAPGSVAVSLNTSPGEQKRIGDKRERVFRADASPSDIAHHHTYLEPSATDTERLRWIAEGRGRNNVFGKPPVFRNGRV